MALSTSPDPQTQLDAEVEKLKPVNRLLVVAQGGTGAAVVRALDRYLKAQGAGFGQPLGSVQIEALVSDTDSAELDSLPEGVKTVLIDDKSVREMLRQRGLEDHVSSPGPALDTSASGAQADPRNSMLKQVVLLDRQDPDRNPVAALEEIFREWKSASARRLGDRVNIAFVGGGHGGTGPGLPYLQVHARDILRQVFGKSRADSITFTRYIMSPESASLALGDPVNGRRHWRNHAASLIKAVEGDERQGLQIAPDRRWTHAGGPLSSLTFLVNASNSDISMDEHYEPAYVIASSLIAQAMESSRSNDTDAGGTSGTDAPRNNAHPVRDTDTYGPDVPITGRSLPVFSALGGARLRLSSEYKKAVFDALSSLFKSVMGLNSEVDEVAVADRAKSASPSTRVSKLRDEIILPPIELDDFGDLEEVPKQVESAVRCFTQRTVAESVPGNVKQVLRDGMNGFVNAVKDLILREKRQKGLDETISFIGAIRTIITNLKVKAQESLTVAKERKDELEQQIARRVADIKKIKIPFNLGPFGKKDKAARLDHIQNELEGENGLMAKCREYAGLERDIRFFEILAAGEVRDGNILDAVFPILDALENKLNGEKLESEGILHDKQVEAASAASDVSVAFDMDFTPPFDEPVLSEDAVATLRQILDDGRGGSEWTFDSMLGLWDELLRRYMPDEKEELLSLALREAVRDALTERAGVLMVPASGTAERQVQNETIPIAKTLIPVDDPARCDTYAAAGYPNPVAVGRGGDFGIVQERHRINPLHDAVARRAIMSLLHTPATVEDARILADRFPGERGLDALLNRGAFFTWKAEAKDPGVLQAFYRAVAQYLMHENGGERYGEIRECHNKSCEIPFYVSGAIRDEERKELERKASKAGIDPMGAEFEAAFKGRKSADEKSEPTSYDYCPGCRPVYGERDAIVEDEL